MGCYLLFLLLKDLLYTGTYYLCKILSNYILELKIFEFPNKYPFSVYSINFSYLNLYCYSKI